MDEKWLHQILQELVRAGVREVCVCSGKRNAPLVLAFDQYPEIKKYPWFEERSAAFFALGRARATRRPVAVLMTSGTAVGECLPATMEAYYSGVPLILLTSDRPSRFRGTGAPQSAEQVGIFGPYALHEQDLENEAPCQLESWTQRGPAHINVCLEEIQGNSIPPLPDITFDQTYQPHKLSAKPGDYQAINQFLDRVERPLVVVGTLQENDRPYVEEFVAKLGAPVYLEATSGLRESQRLRHLRVRHVESLQMDGVLRIGGVPTFRLWRDLESKDACPVCSVSEVPFSGLTRGTFVHTSLSEVFSHVKILNKEYSFSSCHHTDDLYEELPHAEPSLMHHLSKAIPSDARVYLGNSLPIREWDLAAHENAPSDIWASRGLNGIDGQLSAFFGICDPEKENWAILGDLTTLYDMAAPWVLSFMEQFKITIVVVNNGGGMIFNRVGLGDQFTNPHGLDFKHFAKMWNLDYQISVSGGGNQRLVELVPDKAETEKFWQRMKMVKSES
ncbi:MAG: 2-succinyl-5-enolpyruvyl-6-hydroxy-3-cyclohexene-1-carboxylate synthase [Chlamydiae bacterium]|nr:2-succinyl-5-enolpyruvyl-6-hydroxy-3-cyclohexene-1-carboxylate synthase [Chlamydiota bacterium]